MIEVKLLALKIDSYKYKMVILASWSSQRKKPIADTQKRKRKKSK